MTDETQNLRPAGPCVLVIFGASGDLTKRLLIPAVYHLKRSGLLPEHFAIAGVARTDQTDDAFRDGLETALKQFSGEPVDASAWSWLRSRMHYLSGDLDNPETYQRLAKLLSEIDRTSGTRRNYLFYFAIPSGAFEGVVKELGAAELVRETTDQWRRVVIEKPFGSDLPSAKELNRVLWQHVQEDQIFRIDH